MSRFFIFAIALITGCANKSSSSGDFYTWVDERGQVHTVRTKKASSNTSAQATPKVEKINTRGDGTSSMENSSFDASEYTSSDDVDKKLSGQKLFSWNQDGRQLIAEIDTSKNTKDTPEKKHSPSLKAGFTMSFLGFREGRVNLLTDLISRQLSLENLYITQKKSSKDYVLIEIDVADLSYLRLNAFVDSNKVAMPIFNILDSSFNSAATINDAFNNYVGETWSKFGYFVGELAIPLGARYLLIRPNPMPGVVETADGDITLVDFGSLQLTF